MLFETAIAVQLEGNMNPLNKLVAKTKNYRLLKQAVRIVTIWL
jgi:hypothetical protein